MSCLGLKKQFLPTKKAWNGLAAAFHSNLRKLRRSKSIKNAGAALSSVLRRKKVRPVARLPSNSHTQKLQRHHRSFRPVYVDELFNQPPEPVHVKHVVEPSPEQARGKACQKIAAGEHPVGASSSRVDGQLRGVDLEAELFIAKFREEMKLQRQRSFREYQEMLARGV